MAAVLDATERRHGAVASGVRVVLNVNCLTALTSLCLSPVSLSCPSLSDQAFPVSCSGRRADQFNRTGAVCAAGHISRGHPEGC